MSGRVLTGPAVVYGDVARDPPQERIEPGAFAEIGEFPITLQHDPGVVLIEAGGYELTDTGTALEVRAELPEKSAALALVKRGALKGFSIEYFPITERVDANGTVVEQARLAGLSLVDTPSYPGSTARVRFLDRRRVWL